MTNTAKKGKFKLNRWLIVGAGVIALMIGAGVFTANSQARAATPAPATIAVTRGKIVSTVGGSGSVSADETVSLAFQTSGVVAEVLVSEGQAVKQGQVLAKLDDRLLQAQWASAQANVTTAKARLTQAQKGNAKPEDIAAAQAQLASAQANYEKVANGPIAAEWTAARAAVESAEAAYAAAVQSAETGDSQLASLRAVAEKAAVELQRVQADYDKVSWRLGSGASPEAAALQKATIDYEKAKADYEAKALTLESDTQSKIKSAHSQLEQAKANLAKLKVKDADLAVAQASVDQAAANLAKLTAPATETDLAIQQANLAQAEAQLKQAQINLDNASLSAPFDSVVTHVNIVRGSNANSAVAAVKLMNRDPLYVSFKLSENDVVRVQLGQPVALSVDSLKNWKGQGKVSYIAPAAESVNGVVTYAVKVTFSGADPQVKVGMTADLNITTAEKDQILLVPNTALLPKGTGRVAQTLGANNQVVEVEVQIGLSDGVNTEIISGLNEGQKIVALPSTGTRRTGGLLPFGN